MLQALRDKRAGVASCTSPDNRDNRDNRVLVPASSSPAKPQLQSSNLKRATSPVPVVYSVPATPETPGSDATPQLSRLKKRYDADTSPTRAGPAAASSSGRRITGPGVKRTPSLVAAAQAQHSEETEAEVRRLLGLFSRLARLDVVQALKRWPDDKAAVMAELARKQGGYRPAPPPPLPSSKLVATKVVPPGAVASSGWRDTVQSPPVASKPRRNEKSTIYANRRAGRKRDPDEEDETDSESDGWDGERQTKKAKNDEVDAEGATLRAFNEATAQVLTGTIACSEEQAAVIISNKPYADTDDVYEKLGKARGASYKLFENYREIMEGYVQIDACLSRCEAIAEDIASTLAVWKGAGTVSDSITGTPRPDGLNDVKVDVKKVSELLLQEKDSTKRKILQSYIRTQPALLSEGTELKDYQLLGVNWLNLLYSRRIGCILADEMGLGKTVQVIAFIAHLKEHGMRGPHMIFVPASTLENWTREFERFAPDIDVQTYYGTQGERAELRSHLRELFKQDKLEVVLASYTQVSSKDDLVFFRKKLQFETCIYDEAHALKNFASKRYQDLLSIQPAWRLLLTGTPVQNNLQELVSLLMFIHKDTFEDAEPYLRAIFKVQASAQIGMLSQSRVSRARTMLTPFVLRRRKANVLTLPPKTERIEKCVMVPAQARLYRETLRNSRKMVAELGDDALMAAADDDGDKPKVKKAAAKTTSANVLMDLRKAASHPLLFRRLYTSAKVRQIAKACLNAPTWCDSNLTYVIEDLEVMSDAEIHHFVTQHDELAHFALEPKAFLECGKVSALEAHIKTCKAEGKRMLLFSQFTMILDILQVALDHLGVRYIRLDGGTKTDERQGLVDEFDDDEDITVFLLSTKAGGVGINLTAASVVVIFDQDFNPHNDKQAADRAYRIGQEREVEVIKLISKDSIDEDILAIGVTKLQLDDMVGGEDDNTTQEVKKSLLTTLRSKFEERGDDDVVEKEEEEQLSTQVKRARGVKA